MPEETSNGDGGGSKGFPLGGLKPPYYAAIFTSTRKTPPGDETGTAAAKAAAEYGPTAGRMVELAKKRPGFLGMEHLEESHPMEGGKGAAEQRSVTISYWTDKESIAGWKREAEHAAAQARGRKEFYERFEVRVAHVEKGYGFTRL